MSVTQQVRSSRFSTVALVETAVFVAVAFVLSYIRLFEMPQGGSVTLVSMLPIILVGVRRGKLYGFTGAIVFAGLQILQGIYPPPAGTFIAYVLMFLLDYFIAFGVLGVSSFFPRTLKGLAAAVPVCVFLRFIAHFVSGIALWGSYADEGQAAWLYSLLYNGPVMAVEAAITLAAALALGQSKIAFYGLKRP